MQNNRNKMQKIKIDNIQLFLNKVTLSTRLSPRLEFPNSMINHLVLRGMHNPRVYLLLISIPKLTPQLAWLGWHFNSKNSTQKLLLNNTLSQYTHKNNYTNIINECELNMRTLFACNCPLQCSLSCCCAHVGKLPL